MGEKSSGSIVIIDPVSFQKDRVKTEETLGIARVPLRAIKANMEAVFADIVEMFKNVRHTLGACQVAHVDLSLGLAVDGSIGIFGSKVGAEAKGGITVRLVFEQ